MANVKIFKVYLCVWTLLYALWVGSFVKSCLILAQSGSCCRSLSALTLFYSPEVELFSQKSNSSFLSLFANCRDLLKVHQQNRPKIKLIISST